MDSLEKLKHTKHVELLGTATIGPKGQVVIPAEARERMKIAPGDKLVVLYVPQKESVAFVAESRMQSLIDQMGEHLSDLKSHIKNK